MSGCFGTVVIWGRVGYAYEYENICIADAPIMGLLSAFNGQKIYLALASARNPIDPSDFPGIQLAEEFKGEEVYVQLPYDSPGYSEYTPGFHVPGTVQVGGHNIVGLVESHKGEYCVLAVSTKPLDLTEIAGYKDE